MTANRRDFIKFVVAGTVAAGCPIDLSLLAQTAPHSETKLDSEQNEICHAVRNGQKFSRPPASAKYDVVIVGGGVSGLTAAYELQHRNALLLEKEPHWGGNAYLMEYNGSAYAAGAAFLEKDTDAFAFSKKIGLDPLPIANPDGSIINGLFIPDTWGSGLNKLPYPPFVKDSFKKFRQAMLDIDIEKRAQELFTVPFSSLMNNYASEVKQWWDTFGPSNWGATTENTAATIGISAVQYAADSRNDPRYTFPGGLGAITKKLAEILQPIYSDRMQLNCTIVAVVPGKDDVQVTYMLGNEPKTVSAKSVIMATPKFITRRIVEGLPKAQSDAMHRIRYIPYCVVNLIFDKPVFNKGYDTWCPSNTFTDFIVADWVIRKKSGYKQKYNILSCYTPLRESQRASILDDDGAKSLAADVLTDFQKLLPETNATPVEVHIYRRGHPLYMSTPGLYTQTQPLVRQPMDRVFFANTDSEGPESTTNEAIKAARRAVHQSEAKLAGSLATKETAMVG